MNIHSVVMYGDVCVLTPQGSDHDQMIRITNVRVVPHNNECSPAHQPVPVSGLMKAVRNRATTAAIIHIQCCCQRTLLVFALDANGKNLTEWITKCPVTKESQG